MQLLRNRHCASFRSIIVVGHRVGDDDGVTIDFTAASEITTSRVGVGGDSNISTFNISINIGRKAAEVRDADFGLADASDANRCSQSTAAAVCASVRADKLGTPLSVAQAAGTDFIAFVANAVAIEASTVGAAVNVFACIGIATSRGEHQECAQQKGREEKQFLAHNSNIFESDSKSFV